MNKTFRISVMALLGAAALMAASCTKDFENGQSGELIECTLQADMDWAGANIDFGTKVALNADGITPNWEIGDQILVLGADNKPVGTNGIFTLSSGAGTASGKFTGKVNIGQTPKYAIYPASAATVSGLSAVTSGTLSVSAGNDAGSIKSAVMLGTSSDGKSVSFTNACAVLTFNTGDYGNTDGDPAIKSVKVSASYGSTATPIAGAFTINWTATPPTIAPAGSGTVNELTVTLPSTLQANDKNVFIPIFPLPMNGSGVAPSMMFEFTNTDDDPAEVSYDFSAAIAANTMKNLGVAQGMEFKTPGPDPDYWVDLGMVSMDGHRLVVSKKNVKNIVNGVATFCDSDEDIRVTDLLVPTSLKSEDGRTCRPMSLGEVLSLLCPDVFSYSESSGTFIFTSRITGNQIKFPGLSGKRYYAVHHGSYYEIDYALYSKLSVFYSGFETIRGTYDQVKLVSELDNGETIAKTDFDFYGSSSSSFQAEYPLTNNYQDSGKISCISSQELHGGNYVSGTNIFLCVYFENGYRNFGGSEFVVPDWLDLSLISTKDGSACTNYYLDGTCINHVDGKEDSPAAKMVGSANFTSTGVITKYTIWQGLSTCFLSGTLITLADGSRKPVEEITYNDELKVWNFDKGCYDSAKPFWITKAGQTTEQYYRMTFSDGTVLNILGPQYKSGHKLYNYTDRKFEGVKTLEVGKEVYTENGVVTLVSKEEVNEEVEFYCLMTEDHLNCFAEGVLASLRYNNIYPFDENMKFIKDGRNRRPYKEFKAVGISREWYNGLRLGEQADDLATIKQYVDRYDAQTREKPAPTFWQKFRTWWKSIFG